MKNLLTIIAEALVDYPEQVSIQEVNGTQTKVLELSVAKQDIGKVIGRQGRNAQAIRTILAAASAKGNEKTILEIIE